MGKQADLFPPLGWPGGVCHTVERIQEEVKNPRLETKLVEKLEGGGKLTNPEAAKIYDMEIEKGISKTFSHIKIGPHAQYRMDLRGVTVGDIKVGLRNFLKQMKDWRSQKAAEFDIYSEDLMRGVPVEWLDKKLGDLLIVFTGEGRGTIKVITTWWKGIRDPKAPYNGCKVPHRASAEIPMPGYRTMVHEQHPTKSDTGDSGGSYPESGLPSPPWSRSKPTRGPTVFNGPGPSGTTPDGKNFHKDKARTLGVPGSPPPVTDARSTPVRRPGLEASDQDEGQEEKAIRAFFETDYARVAGMIGPPFPPANLRQRDQKGTAKLYDRKKYQKTRGKKVRQMKMRHKRLKNNSRYKLDRTRRKEYEDRFERRPNGGANTISERSQDQRDEKKRSPMQNRQDKKWQGKTALMLQSTSFLWLPSNERGSVRDVSSVTGMVNVLLKGAFLSIPLDDFLEKAYIEDAPFDAFIQHLDFLFGASGSNPDDESEAPLEDTIFEEWLVGRVATRHMELHADVLYEKRPPDMDSENVYDRASDHGDRLRLDVEPGNKLTQPEVLNAPGSGKVIPEGHDFANRSDMAIRASLKRGWGPTLAE